MGSPQRVCVRSNAPSASSLAPCAMGSASSLARFAMGSPSSVPGGAKIGRMVRISHPLTANFRSLCRLEWLPWRAT